MGRGRSWTTNEENQLRDYYRGGELSVFEIADKLDRSVNAILSRAYQMNVRKNPVGNFTHSLERKPPTQLMLEGQECYGIDFRQGCIDNCPRWYSCLDKWSKRVSRRVIEK